MNAGSNPKKTLRVGMLVLADILAVNLAAFLALFSRFEFSMPMLIQSGYLNQLARFALIGTLLTLLVFYQLRLYSSMWEYASTAELARIGGASVLSSLLFMVIGAGAAGAMVIREFNYSVKSENKPVCVLDDDPAKIGTYLRGVHVVGTTSQIAEMAQKHRVEEIVFAIPSADRAERARILDTARATGCSLLMLPGIYQLANGEVSIQSIRKVEIEDLLGRDTVHINVDEVAKYIENQTVLVTGGGGSIGSELCRMAAAQNPKCLIVFDIYENNAYDLQMELRRKYPDLNLVVLIGSVRDYERMDSVFQQYHPDLVFHAAAHKHVPLMEVSPFEAIKNNVFGTYNTALAADKYGARRFILISTDKAVNPTNVMGASKRMCEMIVQMMNEKSKTEYVAVRFGNVLGSAGSVIPLFRRQIAEGGPVTVTDKRIIRYFMTIPEAVQLIFQAGAYAKGGEIFVLDMGDPVRIDDLARNMIRLSGLEPDVDIPIVYTGLRPGEKLYEELLLSGEGMDKTKNDLIYIGHEIPFDFDVFEEQLDQFRRLKEAHGTNEILRQIIREVVPTYHEPQEDITAKEAANAREAALVREMASV